ncbi:MAG TPA: M14 family zinc carboxypeptidase [Solirubrobacterales bacterium]|nr:M14 family zinc carboxypeptidase [Solirubrobacterales bacterium]
MRRQKKAARRLVCFLLLTLVAGLAAAATSAAKEIGAVGAAQGIVTERAGASYRYVTVNPQTKPALTIVERIDMSDGAIDRWWYLRGNYIIPAVAYDGSAGGLSADGKMLALVTFTRTYPPPPTRVAILDTEVYLRHPRRPGQHRPQHAIRYLNLRGQFAFQAISPNASKLYLRHYRTRDRGSAHDRRSDDFDLWVLDTGNGGLAPRPLNVSNSGRQLAGLPISGAASPDGRWAYALYDGDMHLPFLLALDTVTGRVLRVDLPGLEQLRNPYMLKLRLDSAGRHLAVYPRSSESGHVAPRTEPLLSVDVGRLMRWHKPATATASDFLAFTTTPRLPGNLVERSGVIGQSLKGRPIQLRQYGDPRFRGRVLVFACIHGDECAGRSVAPLRGGCPEPNANVFVVSSLNPDGSAAASRLNSRGVDLNRNFPSQWRPRGQPGTPEYSGPRPFSEPETRLAAHLVRRLHPQVTIWFHQIRRGSAFVRAWGPSAPAARLFAHLAGMPFRLMRWPAGTGPNWQNHRFPDSASYVVELPHGALASGLADRLNNTLDRVGRWEAQVGED